MDFLKRKLRDIFSRQEKTAEKREITRFETYFEVCYKILSWEDVSFTLTVFLVLNFVFWLVIQLQLRFFGVIFLLALVGFVADSFVENTRCLVLESPHLEVIEEVKNDLTDVILSLKALRKDNPSSFCICMCLIFIFISFVARNVSGHVISYLLLLGVFFVPLALSKVPPQYLATAKQFIRGIASERGVLAEDELIPYISDKDFNRGDDVDSLLTDKTADSVTSSLISGLNSMPSHLDAEDKESLEEEDLLPSGSNHGGISYTPGEISTDSDSENKPIRFESTHFNGDTSSEEEHFAENLSFARESVDRDVVSNNSLLPNVAAVRDNVVQMIRDALASSPPLRKESSSDSEFEIINSEEADEH